jgi:hypothetical protein
VYQSSRWLKLSRYQRNLILWWLLRDVFLITWRTPRASRSNTSNTWSSMKPVRDPDVRTACETYTDFVHQPLDRLLDLDFGPVLDKIIKVLPRDGRHTYLFSATMSSKVESLQRAALQNPVRVSISSSSHQVVSTLQQRYIFRKFHVQDT